jgi:hypothetical protein
MYVPLGKLNFTAKCYMYNITNVVYHILASFKTWCKNPLKMAQ